MERFSFEQNCPECDTPVVVSGLHSASSAKSFSRVRVLCPECNGAFALTWYREDVDLVSVLCEPRDQAETADRVVGLLAQGPELNPELEALLRPRREEAAANHFGIAMQCHRCGGHFFVTGSRSFDAGIAQRGCYGFPCPQCGAPIPREVVGQVDPASLAFRAQD